MNSRFSKVYPIKENDKDFKSSKLGQNKKSKNQEEGKSSPAKKGRSNHYEDSDCSSSIHSDDRIVRNTKKDEKDSSDEEENDEDEDQGNENDEDGLKPKKKKSDLNKPGSSKFSARNRQFRDVIMQEVLSTVLPTLGNYEGGDIKKRPEDSTMIKWMKFIGCMAMDIHDAVISGSIDEASRTIRKLCVGPQAKPELINEYNEEGFAPLSLAARINAFEICAELIDHHADVECPDMETGRTPLCHAVQNKNHDLVYLLIKYGANPNVADMQCITPLMMASTADDHKTVKMLCNANADVDMQDERGWTALHYAVYSNAIRATAVLLGEGADRDLKDSNGRKPLKYAQYHEYGELISLLSDKQGALS